ncbi:MAG: HEAT repeat domain-containing protein [Planctomycetota bacterium]|nr:MAG: HEAT repeat domain-containing protein [Planctomycetota bacterium]
MRADGVAATALLMILLAAGCAKPYLELRGCLVDADTEKPIGPGARVRVVTTTRSFSNSSDSEGKFIIRYAVDRDEASDLAAWLLVAEASRHESKIIPMFQPVRLFGYYLRRRVKIRLKKRPGEKPSRPEILPEKSRKDPLAFDEPIKRIHALSKCVYLDALQKRAKADGNAATMEGYPPGRIKRNDFIGALAAHIAADKSSILRRDAARVAWRWNSPEIVHALMVALDDKNKNVRYWASRSLERISGVTDLTLYRDDDEKTRKEKAGKWWEWYKKRK